MFLAPVSVVSSASWTKADPGTSHVERAQVLDATVRPPLRSRHLCQLYIVPHAYRLLVSIYRSLRTVHSALCTRVLLNLRKAAASGSNSRADEFTIMTTLALESLPMFAPVRDDASDDCEGEDAV